MKKRITAMILGAAMVMGVLAGCGSAQTSNDQEAAAVSTAEAVQESEAAVESTSEGESQAETSDSTDAGKTLVVYYSAQGHTVNFANAIAEELDADLFELTPVEEYTEEDLDWRDENSRVSREHDDESLRDIELVTTEVENWDSYDTVYIGYPIWWGIAAWPVDNFVKNNDFTGKTV
ncbi:MAG: flavodoxin, partial [Eubacteriales bacterium]|nr:flavodoxin [Eubacteriales bacterium]